MDEVICGIYKITNLINGKSYIGQSINIKRRIKEHMRDYLKFDYAIYKAIRKYGIGNFSFDILCECKKDELDDLEIKYINEFRSYGRFSDSKGYNETLGGKGLVGYYLTATDLAAMKRSLYRIKNMTKEEKLAMKTNKMLSKLRRKKGRELFIKAKAIPDGDGIYIYRENYDLEPYHKIYSRKEIDVDDNELIEMIERDIIEDHEGNETMQYFIDIGLYDEYEGEWI